MSMTTRRLIEPRVRQVHQSGSRSTLMIRAGCTLIATTTLTLALVGIVRAVDTPAATASRLAEELQSPTPPDEPTTVAQQRGPTVITGRVTDKQGQVIEGAEISIFQGVGTLHRTAVTKTGKDGRYTLQYFTRPRWEATQIGPPRKDGLVARNFHRPGGDWVMVPAASIAGELVDQDDRPICNRKLCLGGPALEGSCTTDEKGRFHMGTLRPESDFWFYLASTSFPRCQMQSQPLHLGLGEPFQAKLRLATSNELGMELLEVVHIADATGNDLTGKIDGAMHFSARKRFKPGDAKVQAQGRAVLDKLIETNRYWLLGPSPEVKHYEYDFLLDGEAALHVVVDNPRTANLWRRQGIAWHSGLHYLARHPDQAVFGQVEFEGDQIRLTYLLKKMTFAADGDGIEKGSIYCGQNFYGGTLTVDRRTHTPSRHQCIVTYSRYETYSDFVEIDPGHYVPMAVEVSARQRRRWTFAIHGQGLWLFESNHSTTGRGPKHARVENVAINGRPATKQAEPKQAADVDRGRNGGRPKISTSEPKVLLAKKLYADKSLGIDDICKTLRMSRSTFYRYVRL